MGCAPAAADVTDSVSAAGVVTVPVPLPGVQQSLTQPVVAVLVCRHALPNLQASKNVQAFPSWFCVVGSRPDVSGWTLPFHRKCIYRKDAT